MARIFGSAPGQYGAGAADHALDSEWKDRSELADAYLNASAHTYGRGDNATPAADQFRNRVAAADALVHPQDDRERDLLDGDGVADFVGGFSALAASLGNVPVLYHLDTSKPETPIARTVSEEITRIVRGRLTNKKWVKRMLQHGHRGVAEIAQGVDALYAFAATTRAVPSHLFDAVHEMLIADEEISTDMMCANPDAASAIATRLQDALKRGLWTTRRNSVHEELEQRANNGLSTHVEAAQ